GCTNHTRTLLAAPSETSAQTAPTSTPDRKSMQEWSSRSSAARSPKDGGFVLPRPPADVRTMHQLPNRADTPLDQSLATPPRRNGWGFPQAAALARRRARVRQLPQVQHAGQG